MLAVRMPFVAAAAVALGLLGPAGAARAVTTVSLGADTATISNTVPSVGQSFAISIDPKGAGAADDVLVVDALDNVTGCPTQLGDPTKGLCPLTAARSKVVGSFSGAVADNTITVDLDRPDLMMTGTFSGGTGITKIDGSATGSGNLVLTGTVVTGGGGDDVLIGTAAPDTLTGGAGDDSLSGLAGRDQLAGGPGDDAFVPGAGGLAGLTESVDGGEGTQDTVSFAGETVPVTVSLDGLANDGPAGHAVLISGIEAVGGGQAADLITGNGGFNHLYGLGGDDVIDGAGGGHDVLRGGPGNDVVRGRDASPLFSDLACGSGIDTAEADALDVVASDCENVQRSPAPTPTPGGGGTGTGGANGGDRIAPRLTVGGLPRSVRRSVLRRGLGLTIAASERATVVAELYVTARRVASTAALRDNLLVARRTSTRVLATRSIRLVPDRLLLGAARSVTVRLTATDAAGNRRVTTRRIAVR